MKNIFKTAQQVKDILPNKKRFTLVGGAFDLIHVGHLHLLEYASSLNDLLVVAVLSDDFIRTYKDSMRPIINQRQRAIMLTGLRFVDYVYISNVSPSSVETLQLLKPNSVVFGGEESNGENVRRWSKRIEEYSPNTKIELLPRYWEENISTSHIITTIQNLSR